MLTLYHASRKQLAIGTALKSQFVKYRFQWEAVASALDEPEHRIPILKSLLLTDNFTNKGRSVLPFVLKEVVLERIRANEFPDRPSRLNCAFLSPSKRDIVRFRNVIRETDDRPHLYLCTAEDATITFCGDISHVGSARPLALMKDQLDYLIEQATRYWQGKQGENPLTEVLAPADTATVTAQAEW